jgi:predicted RNase H-like HicB family nuclease
LLFGVAGGIVALINIRGIVMFYPVSIRKKDEQTDYQITVVDLPGCQCSAANIDLAMQKIVPIMAQHLTLLAEYGEAIPQAKSIEQHRQLHNDQSIIWALVEFDITPFMGKSHKINVTLPELLIKQIDDRVGKNPSYKSRSGFIATACLQELAKTNKHLSR